jgi:hypothetical protein
MHNEENNLYKNKANSVKGKKPSGFSSFLQINKLRRGDSSKPKPVPQEEKSKSSWNPLKAVKSMFTSKNVP